jgi:pimeloyl-ACP methyl ester carboxylesterase
MTYVERGDATVYCEWSGEGPGILLTHGYSASAEMWRGQVPALARRHCTVVWDIRGHGRTETADEPSAYTEAASLGDMAAVLDAAGVDRAVVGGLSLGGYLSLAFRLAWPSRVAGLILADTGPGFRREESRAVWNAEAEEIARGHEAPGPDRSSGGEGGVSHGSPSGLVRAARGILPQHDARVIEALPDIDVPTLVIVGEGDTPFRSAADYLAAKIPGATQVVIPEAGHDANLDQPDAFNRAVTEFLTEMGW